MATLGLTAKPFFDDKNRAFWNLQTAGWAGYFLLRTLSGFANGLTLAFLVPVAVSTATGYSLTLVLGALYRDLLNRKPIVTWVGSIGGILIAAGIYSLIDAWIFNTIQRPGERFQISLGTATAQGQSEIADESFQKTLIGSEYLLDVRRNLRSDSRLQVKLRRAPPQLSPCLCNGRSGAFQRIRSGETPNDRSFDRTRNVEFENRFFYFEPWGRRKLDPIGKSFP